MSEQDGNFPVGESAGFNVNGVYMELERVHVGVWHRRDQIRTAIEITGIINRTTDGYEAGYLTGVPTGLPTFASWTEALRHLASLPVNVVDDN